VGAVIIIIIITVIIAIVIVGYSHYSHMEREGSELVEHPKSDHSGELHERSLRPPISMNEICRVCRCEGTKDSPLFYPCLCSGSIKYVHQDCLIQWLRHSRKTYCELCQHPFIFHPIYAENMPERLPFLVVLRAMFRRLYRFLGYSLRYVLVAMVWILLVPYLTYHLWKIYFGDIGWHRNIGWPQSWITDCIEGGILSIVIIGVFLCFIGLRDYLVLYGTRPEGDIDERQERAAIRRRRSRRGILRHFQGSRSGTEVVMPMTGLEGTVNATTTTTTMATTTTSPSLSESSDTIRPQETNRGDLLFPDDVPAINGHQRMGVEEISLDQLLGLEGPWSMLVENVVWVILFNLTFLGLFAFLPYHMGKTVTRLGYQISCIVWDRYVGKQRWFGQSMDEHLSLIPFYLIQKPLFVEKLMLIMLGYCMMATLLSRYLAFESIQRWAYRRYLSKMIHFLITLFYVFFKVSVLLLFEVGAFPVFCGFVLDMATLRLFDATWHSRIQFLSRSPTLTLFLHWIVGLSFMIHFSNFIRMLRDILRPGALWFLRNQNDPEYNAMKEMIDISGSKHVFRLCVSLVMYGMIIITTFGVPLAIVTRVVPGLLPLRWSAIDPFPEMPFDLLLFHVVLPFALKRLPLKRLARSLLKQWFVFSSRLLCLSSYMLDVRRPSEESPAGTVSELPAYGRIRPQLYRSHPAIIRAQPSQRAIPTTVVYKPPSFGFRIACLVALTWTTVSIVLVSILLLPIYTGRVIFWRTMSLEVHDAYSFCVGLYMTCLVAHSLHDFIKDLYLPSRGETAEHRPSFVSMLFRSCWNMMIIGCFVVFIIPLLMGILFDLTVTQPMRTILHESPVVLVLQDWALGLFFCKVARRVLLHSPDSSFRQGLVSLRDTPWHAISLSYICSKLLIPVSLSLITLIGVPFLMSRYVCFLSSLYFPSDEQVLLEIRYFLDHFCYSSTFFAYSLYWWGHHIRQGTVHLLRSVRDDEYLIGRQLRNLERDESSSVPS
jgi:E3 ubiquitin-protein ligase MARCH6